MSNAFAELHRRMEALERQLRHQPYHMVPLRMAHVYNDSVVQTIADTTWAALEFDTEEYDYGDFWAAGNPTRFTIARDGIYHVGGGWEIDGAAGNIAVACTVRVNGSTFEHPAGHVDFSAAEYTSAVFNSDLKLDASDYIELMAWQDGSVGGETVAPNGWARFWIRRVG